jgi:eukaryotic-like serine/threonine-protein kinase
MTAETLFADRYRLDRRLGIGGMATVQLAFDTRLERYVAVKLLAEHLAEDRNFVSRFRREALAVARLVHPNIVQVYDFGTDARSGRQYIVMEYVDGPSCAEILRDTGTLPPHDAVGILTQACRALAYAHRNGVVHRDVKPGNLLRSRDGGQVKLADFGIAKAAEQSDITKVGSVVGTAAYLAPEQARGEPAGPASDMYALGVVSYQLLAGRLPYEAASLTDLARQQESGRPPLLHELEPEIPAGLSLAVERALARDPVDRYPDAHAMEQALADGLRDRAPEPTAATRPLSPTEATRMLDRTEATRPIGRQSSTRSRMQPIEEATPPPRARRSAAPPTPPPAPVRRAPARRESRRRGVGLRRFMSLLLLVVVVAAGAAAYVVISDASQRGVQLRQQVQGDAQQTVDELKQLIEDNVR